MSRRSLRALLMVLCALAVPGEVAAAGWLAGLFKKGGGGKVLSRSSKEMEAVRTLSLGEFSGSTGVTAGARLRQQFTGSSELRLLEGKGGKYVLSGSSVGGRLEARLTTRDGKELFQRSYGDPSLEENIAALADDVVLEVTGTPGVANTRIAFVSSSSGSKQVYVCQPDGSELVQVTRHRHGAVSPALSPDGTMLGYTSYASGFPAIMMVDMGGGSERNLAATPGANSGLAFAPEDRRAALTMSFLGNPEVFVIDLGSNNAVCVSETTGVPSSPTWHPAGELLMFANDDGNGSSLYVVNVSSEAPARSWNSGTALAAEPDWSPDGKTIAFTTRVAGDWAVALRPYQGGSTTILRRSGAQHPSWAPDGVRMAYVEDGQLWVHNVRTGARVSIVRGMAGISEPKWMR